MDGGAFFANGFSYLNSVAILTEFIKVNLAAIKTDDDWSAFYRHMNAINGYLVLNTADK